MSFEKLQLPDFVITSLYKDKLVVLDEAGVTQLKEPEIKKQPVYLGENKQQVVILVNDDEAVYLRDEWLDLLSNMLNACKLNLGDVAIINIARNQFSYTGLKELLSPKFLLLFGVPATGIALPFTVPHYQVQQYDQCSFLLAPSLASMISHSQGAKLEKSKLWLSLKKMFPV